MDFKTEHEFNVILLDFLLEFASLNGWREKRGNEIYFIKNKQIIYTGFDEYGNKTHSSIFIKMKDYEQRFSLRDEKEYFLVIEFFKEKMINL